MRRPVKSTQVRAADGLRGDGTTGRANRSSGCDQQSAWLGRRVGWAGDVNGDGFVDIVTAARYYDAGQTDEGRVFVFHGPWPEVYLPVTLRDWP